MTLRQHSEDARCHSTTATCDGIEREEAEHAPDLFALALEEIRGLPERRHP